MAELTEKNNPEQSAFLKNHLLDTIFSLPTEHKK